MLPICGLGKSMHVQMRVIKAADDHLQVLDNVSTKVVADDRLFQGRAAKPQIIRSPKWPTRACPYCGRVCHDTLPVVPSTFLGKVARKV